MGIKINTLFLFVVLVLGMAAYPASINPTSLDSSPLNTSFLTAFAEEDDEERDEDETDDQEKDDENELENDDEKDDENELENDEEKDEDETDDQEKDDDDEKDDENELENDEEKDEDETDDQEKDDDDNERDEDEEELEIEVEVKNDKAKIKIELNDDDYRFVLTNDVSESAIIAAIIDKTGLTEDEITSNWEFEIEDEEREDEEDDEGQENNGDSQVTDTAKTDKLIKHENKAQENAEETILELQQKIDQLEQRLQKLLEKFETGEYFGTVTAPDPVPDSFVITIDGFASSLDDDTVVSNMEGEIFLESLVTGSESTKLRITGGEILVGDTFYDFVIGKARLSSSGTSGEKDSMIILGQIMDDQGNVNTIRLSLDGTTSLDDFGSESVDFEINSSRSKIASQWGFDGIGLLSTL